MASRSEIRRVRFGSPKGTMSNEPTGGGSDAASATRKLDLTIGEAVTLKIRVRYFETDQMGIVHHANYAVWFEAARSEYCRVHGIDYRGMEADGLALPVLQLSVRYASAAHYEDELNIRAKVIECRRSLLRIVYSVERDGKSLATGETLQMLIERATGKPRSFTAEMAARFLASP